MPASKAKTSTKTGDKDTLEPTLSFEQAFAELEGIVAQMESGQMPLEASLEAYKRGNLLLGFCQQSLADVEQQVKVLNERQQLAPFNTND
ncbi:exodeoxyribonuclease VII small subunit [Methylotenera oryzisoli]|jgi:exodeoxyribonuclease VII small subunit|uniref:Exodeoxyribonuclease 7 small subunit n=1 Tax=Methylotenera oryzisoli TaxID=2080758 RepID=A0A4Y9VV68_9PROT|nr:exodeoxyribonuclease VII small subunit [Methylotenera oryzisoli]TFW73350.1 exodeoxyribonuclease VII small subunit [Methylotenera oryzisoli]